MDLNNLLHTRPVYDRYPQPTEGAQQQSQQSPQIQLPTQPTPNEPQVVSTVHEGRLYRYERLLPLRPKSGEQQRLWGALAELRIYSLDIVQQPVRARMCGFGDKVRNSESSAGFKEAVILGTHGSVKALWAHLADSLKGSKTHHLSAMYPVDGAGCTDQAGD